MSASVKEKLGALVYDLPGYAKQMWLSGGGQQSPWVFIRNRSERLSAGPQNNGARCEWEWTSDLHIARVFPRLGRELMRRALRDWPIVLDGGAARAEKSPADVTFVIGHKGEARLPHLLTTLRGIAAQRGASIECVVVEQSARPEVQRHLPAWVRYVHAPLPHPDAPYCRSHAFNVGAAAARGTLLVLHDNDLLVPRDYASELMRRHRDGYEVINLKRFIFYLSPEQSRRVSGSGELDCQEAPETVMQNAQGGGSLAVAREAYMAVGGFDESFVGWGGEDNEFWERAQTRTLWPYGYLPFIHLWHEAQPDKFERGRRTAELFERRSAIPLEQRIEELRARNFQPALSGLQRQASSHLAD